MKLDLQKDFNAIYAHLVERVQNFDPNSNKSPGEPGPVKFIEVGFEYSQGDGWVAIVFDTRPDAEPDGEWNSYSDVNSLARPHWAEAGEVFLDEPITVVSWDGQSAEFSSDKELAEPIGEMLKAVLLKAKVDEVFAKLPKAKSCEMGVEHQCGAYGWPLYDDRGKENVVE